MPEERNTVGVYPENPRLRGPSREGFLGENCPLYYPGPYGALYRKVTTEFIGDTLWVSRFFLLLCATNTFQTYGKPNRIFKACQMLTGWFATAMPQWVPAANQDLNPAFLNCSPALYHTMSLYLTGSDAAGL